MQPWLNPSLWAVGSHHHYTGLRPGRPPPSSGKTSTLPGMRSRHQGRGAAHGPSRPPETPPGPGISPCARSRGRPALLAARGAPESPVFPSARGGVRRQQPAAAVETLCPGPGPADGGQSPGRRGGPARHTPDLTPYCLRHTLLHRPAAGGGCPSTWPRSSWATPTSP